MGSAETIGAQTVTAGGRQRLIDIGSAFETLVARGTGLTQTGRCCGNRL